MSDQIEFSLLSHLAIASRLSLGFIFLLSAWVKLRSPLTFARTVAEYKIVPARVAYGLALTLIPLEVFLAITFVTGWQTYAVLPVATTTLCLFFIAVTVNLRRGQRIACGCFGDTSEQISLRTLVRLSLLLATVLLLLVFKETTEMQLPDLTQMSLDSSTLIYLMQTSFLAMFLILMANWFLSVPEISFLVRQGYGDQLGDKSAQVRVEDA